MKLLIIIIFHFQILLVLSRPKEIAFPRQIAMYLVRELLGTSLPAIGTAFGGRDHTTVMYAYKQISDKMKNDMDVQKDIDSIKRKF